MLPKKQITPIVIHTKLWDNYVKEVNFYGTWIIKVKLEEKDILYRLLQLALYDGSYYIDNIINNQGIFEYKYFEDYFLDETRDKYFIKYNGKLAGFVLINENNKFNSQGKTIAEFLILPPYRRKHLGKEAAIKAFELYPGTWKFNLWKIILNA